MSVNSTIWDTRDANLNVMRDREPPYFSLEVVWHGQGYDADFSITEAKALKEALERTLRELEK